MDLFLLLYNFIFTTVLGISALAAAQSREELLFGVLFIPLALYFGNRLSKFITLRIGLMKVRARRLKRSRHALTPTASVAPTHTDPALVGNILEDTLPIRDRDRRLFLKLIASSSMSLFLLSLFTKRSHAAFFGSVPGPGTVAVKDSSGNTIDPAEKQPTDGYEIAQIDDTSSSDYAWYGFVNKNGAWYITQEDLLGADAGTYLYAAGTTDFATSWTGRSGLTYATFDTTF